MPLTLAELTTEIESHLKASEHLARETARLASAIAADSTSVNAAAATATFQSGEGHRHRTDRLNLVRMVATDLVQRTTRIASLCMGCVIELARIYSGRGTPAALEQLARASDLAERLVQLCDQQMTLYRLVLEALRSAQGNGSSNAEAAISDAAQQEMTALVERLRKG